MAAWLDWEGGNEHAVLPPPLAGSDSSVKTLYSLPPFSIQSWPPPPRPLPPAPRLEAALL